ncbi:AAA family ATPase [Streptomyces bluensis]|uniref:AAA family ATPase n=1 Tax=Streptomyces bluensis TaxID=33897 RepID=A0ABW6UVA0_9ACTN
MNRPVTAARQLVVVSVGDYRDGDGDFTRAVAAQVSIVTDWLAGPDLPDADRFKVSQPVKLEQAQDLRRFLLEKNLAAAAYDEALVVYITGHGVTSAANHHYLTFASTDPRRLVGTAFPTRELIGAVLDSQAEHVLVLVDSCFAGALGAEITALVNDLTAARRKLPTLAVITSGDVHEQPYVGEFTRLIALTLERAADEASGYVNSHLSLADWERLLAEVGDEHPEMIEPVWVWPRSRKPVLSACLPNPAYRPQKPVVGPARREVSLSPETLQYWVSRASGRTGDEDAGWYFSGRRVLMRELVDFVHDGSGVLVVTGAAGSGKSGLLARLVTLSDPVFLDLPDFRDVLERVPEEILPSPGAVDAAVLARAKTSLGLIEDLLQALGHTESSSDRPPLQVLLGLLARRSAMLGRPVTVIIDGLDEASEPLACISDVVVPLARHRRSDGPAVVRLLVGLRSSSPARADDVRGLRDERADRLLTGLQEALEGTNAQQQVACGLLRTDQPDSTEDIAAYAQALLVGGERSPYREEPAAAAAAARSIAAAVWPSFLDARLAGAQLRTAARVKDLGDRAWQSRLESGTAALLRADIQHVARDHQVRGEVLLAVLRATALAQGSGLPWAEVWPAAVRGVLGHHVPEDADLGEAIRIVHASRLAGYLAHGVEDGRATYRPVHQRVAEALLNEPASLLTEDNVAAAQLSGLGGVQRTHRSIALQLAGLARDAAPLPAHPYVRRHLLAHADAGAVLDDEHVPASLLVQETSGTVRARLRLPLPVHDMGRPTLVAAALIEPYVGAGVDEASRLSSIAFQRDALRELAHGQGMLPPPEADFSPLQPMWTTDWSQWQSRTNVLASVRGAVNGLCAFGTADGRGLVAAASGSGVEVWESATGQRLVHIRIPQVRDLVSVTGRGGRTFVVTAAREGAAVWDPLSGRCLASLPAQRGFPGMRAVRVLQDGDEEWLIAVLAGRHVWLWQPGEEQAHQLPHEVAPGRATDLVVVHGRNEPGLLAYPSPQGRSVMVCDPRSSHVQPLEMPYQFTGRALAAVRGPDGHDVLVTPHGFRHGMYVWDPYSGRRLAGLTGAAQDLYSLTGPDGHRVLGVKSGTSVRIHDLSRSLSGDNRLGTVTDDGIRAVAGVPGGGDGPWTVATAGDGGIRLTAPITALSRAAAAARDSRHHRAAQNVGPLRSMHLLSNPFPSRLTGTLWHVLVGVRAGRAVLLDADDGLLLSKLPGRRVRSVQPFPPCAGESLLAVATEAEITVWDLNKEVAVGTVPVSGRSAWYTTRMHTGAPALVVASSEGLHLFTGDGNLVWDNPPPPFGRRPSVPLGRSWPPSSLHVWDSFRSKVIVAGAGSTLLLWNLESGEFLGDNQLPGQGPAHIMTSLPRTFRGPLLAVAGGHQVTVWDGLSLHATLKAPAPVNTLAAVTASGRHSLLATGGGTGIQLWDVDTRDAVHTLLTAAPVSGLAHQYSGGSHRLWLSGPAGIAALDGSLPLT